MANILYNAGVAELLKSTGLWLSATYMVMLEKKTGAYTADKDHATLAALFAAGFVELDATGYARQTITGKLITKDDANDLIILDCNDIDFGVLSGNMEVNAVVVFRDGASDSERVPLLYVDSDANALLPRQLSPSGSPFKIQIAAEGLANISQAP